MLLTQIFILSVIQRGALQTNCIQNWGSRISTIYVQEARLDLKHSTLLPFPLSFKGVIIGHLDKFAGYVLVAGFDANSFMLVKNPLIRFLVNMFMNLLNIQYVEKITQVYCELFELVSNLSNFSLETDVILSFFWLHLFI